MGAAAAEAAAAAADAEAVARRKKQEQEEEEEARRKARGQEILSVPEPVAAGNSTAKLSVRLPDGTRIQRVFPAEKTLDEIHEWVHCCRSSPCPPRFELHTSFPARALTERSRTLAELDLAPSAVLLLKAV